MNKNRRVEKIIDDCLPAIRSGQETIASVLETHPRDAAAIRPKLEAAVWLAKAGTAMDPRPGFISSSAKSLELRIASIPPRTAWQRLLGSYTPQRWIFNLASPVLLVVILALMLNNLVLAARLSIPGDPFYPAKLVIEDIRLSFTYSLEDKTELYIQYSHERSMEFMELVLDGEYEQLPAAANRMETDIIAALHSLYNVSLQDPRMEPSMTTELRDTLTNEIFMLNVLRDTSPTSARRGIDLAVQVARSGVMALH